MLNLTEKRLFHAGRNARDYETLPQHSEAMLTLATLTLIPAGSAGNPSNPMPRRRHVQKPHFEPLDPGGPSCSH